MGEAVGGLAGRRSAVINADHGPVEAGKDIEAACHAVAEPGKTAKLVVRLGRMPVRGLSPDQVQAVVTKSDVDWNT